MPLTGKDVGTGMYEDYRSNMTRNTHYLRKLAPDRLCIRPSPGSNLKWFLFLRIISLRISLFSCVLLFHDFIILIYFLSTIVPTLENFY